MGQVKMQHYIQEAIQEAAFITIDIGLPKTMECPFYMKKSPVADILLAT